MKNVIRVVSEFNKWLNLKPKYHAYKGNWTKLNRCKECDMYGLYEDMHSVNVCPNCGGQVGEGVVGRWTGEWETGFFSSGHWEKVSGKLERALMPKSYASILLKMYKIKKGMTPNEVKICRYVMANHSITGAEKTKKEIQYSIEVDEMYRAMVSVNEKMGKV